MSDESVHVLNDALRLPDDARGELAARLIDSLDRDADADAAAAWADELRTRLADLRAGRVTPVGWDEARRRILADDDAAG